MGGTGFPVPLNAWGDFTAPHGEKRALSATVISGKAEAAMKPKNKQETMGI